MEDIVDDIGGIVERVVWRVVFLKRVLVVVDVLLFIEVVFELCKIVKVSFISLVEFKKFVDLFYFSICFKEVVVIYGILKYY